MRPPSAPPHLQLRDYGQPGRRHLWSFCRVTRYSEDHRCQKCRSRDWHKCHRLSAVMGRSSMSEFGIASRGLPMRKCPGVKASMPSSSSGRGTSGLLLRQASIWHKTVESSSKLSFTLPMIRARCFFRLLTAASHNPPKWGALSGIKSHAMPWDVQKSVTASSVPG